MSRENVEVVRRVYETAASDVAGEHRDRARIYEEGLIDHHPGQLLELGTPDIENVNARRQSIPALAAAQLRSRRLCAHLRVL